MPPPLNKNIAWFVLMLGCFLFTTILLQSVHAGKTVEAALDTDRDGVTDAQDECPNTAQIFKVDPNSRIAPLFEPEHLMKKTIAVTVDVNGCAIDRDKDGIPDHQDYCPNDTLSAISAGITKRGCPLQSDGDGTPDYRDKCPGTLRGVSTDRFGCPKKN